MYEQYRTRISPLGRVAAGVALALAAREGVARLRERDLRGKVALITGGSRGLGLAMARAFADAGCIVALCARDEAELDRAREDLERRGADALTLVADVSVRSDVERVVGETERILGPIDILVNNAGIISVGPVETVTTQDIEDNLSTMLWGTVYPIWEAMPRMQARRSGHIVNITSLGGKVSIPHLLPYSVAKFAAVGLSEGLRAELAKDGVGVTTVVPGLMRTGSYLHTRIKGQRGKEFGLFSAMANLPLFSISAESAAASVVRAVRRNAAEVVLSPQGKILTLFHGVFPGATTDILGAISRVLPRGDSSESEPEPGAEIEAEMAHPRLADPLGLGDKAARDLNER
jgi:NAD(P)-dependent dehydrogenase (short-subunit alcohol dehydrogenase family)